MTTENTNCADSNRPVTDTAHSPDANPEPRTRGPRYRWHIEIAARESRFATIRFAMLAVKTTDVTS
jgi:hypothetical protein